MAHQKLPGVPHKQVGAVSIRSDGTWFYCCMTPPGCRSVQVVEQFRKAGEAYKWARENQQ